LQTKDYNHYILKAAITWVVFLRIFWNFISSLPVKRGWSLSFLVGTISNFSVMEIGWTDVGSYMFLTKLWYYFLKNHKYYKFIYAILQNLILTVKKCSIIVSHSMHKKVLLFMYYVYVFLVNIWHWLWISTGDIWFWSDTV
jgi:hypothetical protein